MPYTEREVDAARHIAAAQAAFAQHQAAERALSNFSYDYVWSPGGDAERLHKMAKGEVLKDFGPRDARLEAIVQTYEARRQLARDTFAQCTQERDRMQRLNRAHQIGRLLTTPVKVLDVLWRRGIMDYYTVIGTYAMYAYEAAAGVVFDEPTMATNDVDLFYRADKQMRFAQLIPNHESMVELLREADPTFDRNEDQKESAMNSEGFSIDFLRREEAEKYSDAFSISGAEGDILPVQARRSNKFLGSPVFDQVVIAVDGAMTTIRTIDPRTFMEFKRWMSEQRDRDTLKRNRDRRQALAIEQLLDDGRLKSRL